MKPTPTSPPDGPLILAIGAHPDDIEFGCGGVIARETQAGHAAHFVVCSLGESGTNGTPKQRMGEAKKAAALLGATIEFVDFGGDAHMELRLAHTLKIARIIRRLRPRFVLAPTTTVNQHPDHVVVGQTVRNATRLARYGGLAELKKQPRHVIEQLLFYPVTVEAEAREQMPVLVDISAPSVVAAWTASMEAHASQQQTRRYADLHLARAKVHGMRSGVSYAMQLYPADPMVCTSLAALGRSARTF
jgi:LmbE family N-acetylglucosaminyl deacetylase